MVTKRESEANVVDAANRVTSRGVLPNLIHQAFSRIVEDAPDRILPKVFYDDHCFFGREWLGTNYRVPQQGVDFDQDQLAKRET